MSDHEGEDIDFSSFKITSGPAQAESVGAGAPRASLQRGNKHQTAQKSSAETVRSRSDHLVARTGNQTHVLNHDKDSHPTVAPNTPVGPEPQMNPAYADYRTGAKQTGSYEFNIPLYRFHKFSSQNRLPARLEEISGETQTFMLLNGRNVQIWGTPDNAERAKSLLSIVEQERAPIAGKAASQAWVKSKAFDGRTENRKEIEMCKKKFAEQVALKSKEIDYPVQASLLWPKDLDPEAFCKDNQDNLNKIKSRYICSVAYIEKPVPHFQVKAMVEAEVFDLYRRLLNLIKEMVSRRNEAFKMSLVKIPHILVFRDRVSLEVKEPGASHFWPLFHGNEVPANRQPQHEKMMEIASQKNRAQFKEAIRMCLKNLHLANHHIRMRVCFGKLGFLQFMRPNGTEPGYPFEDFANMVSNQRTKLSLGALPVKRAGVADLPDLLDSMGVFTKRHVRYGAQFDFSSGGGNDNILRLETSFGVRGDGPFDTEMLEQRYVDLSRTKVPLELNTVCFEGPDYQIAVNALPLHDFDPRRHRDLTNFMQNVRYEQPAHGAKAFPRLRVRYPAGQQNLRAVGDLVAIRWNFKDGDGIFELRRRDLYPARGVVAKTPMSSEWHGLYYYPEWDNLMGQFAGLDVGDDVTWKKQIETFFPGVGERDEGLSLPRGFKAFMTEVEEIQERLRSALERLVKGTDGEQPAEE